MKNVKKITNFKVLCIIVSIALFLATPFTLVNMAYAYTSSDDLLYGESLSSRGMNVKDCPNITAHYACIMKQNGEIIYERNSYDHAKIASLTKIMTAIIALENSELTDEIIVTKKAYEIGESSAGVWPGDKLSMESGLYALLVPSGNDAAEAISQTIGQKLIENKDDRIRNKSVEEVKDEAKEKDISEDEVEDVFIKDNEQAFVRLMNLKAKEIGCENTNFTNPHGLADDEYASDEQYCCAIDIAKITKYAMQNEIFRKIVGGGDTSIVVDRDGQKVTLPLASTDILLGNFEGCIGVKTGKTDIGGACFSGAMKDSDGDEIYTIVLKSDDETQRFIDTQELFNWYLTNKVSLNLTDTNVKETMQIQGESPKEVGVVAYIAHSEWVNCTIPVTLKDSDKSIPVLIAAGNVHLKIEPNEIKGSYKAGDKVADLVLTQHNKQTARVDLIAIKDQAAPNIFESIGVFFDRLIKNIQNEKSVADNKILANCDKINKYNDKN